MSSSDKPKGLDPGPVQDESRSASPGVKRRVSQMADGEPHSQDVPMGMESAGEESSDGAPRFGHRRAESVDMEGPEQDKVSRQECQRVSSDESGNSSIENLYPTPSSMSAYTAPTSTRELSKSQESVGAAEPLPTIDEQVATVMALMARPLDEKQKGYVLSASWLNRVLARSAQPQRGNKVDKSASEGEVGPVDNSDLLLVTDPTATFKDEAGEPFVPLRPGLQMGEDFEIVPQEAWDLIMKWYGLADQSPAIIRYSHNTNSTGSSKNIQYEINPPVFTILTLSSPAAQKERNIPPVKTLASRHTNFQKWLKHVKALANIDLSTKVRVWRILGGLSSSNTSGVLTPAASRSSSPAPGATIVAHAGNNLALDVNTFVSLAEGSQRELLEDARDQTTNEKYNGSMTLELAGLGGNDVVLLEEQIGGPGGGEWVSDVSKHHLNRFTLASGNKSGPAKLKSMSASASGRSSPILEPLRGRRKDGKPRGNTGLSNLGNTCYMNSALQCVRSVEELTHYFLNDIYKQDLNPNNPLSHNGDVARAYAHFVHTMYDESGPSSFAPRQLKQTVGRYGPAFSGYGQQDSQEFLLFLLDGLQEDLNRIQKKPYIEKPDSTDEMVHNQATLKEFADKCWDIYKARNDSVITDLFAGMYKSTVVCPVCDKVSIIFDPFNNLTLQLPIENLWSKEIFYFPLHRRPVLIDMEIDKNATVRSLKELVARKMGYDPQKLIMAEIYKFKFYKLFDNTTAMAECQIGTNDDIGLFEVEMVPTNYNPDKPKRSFSMLSFGNMDTEEIPTFESPKADRLLVPIVNRIPRLNTRYQARQLFGAPGFIVVRREEAQDYESILRKVLAKVATLTTQDILSEKDGEDTHEEEPPDSDTVVMNEEDANSADSKIKTSSVEGEDGLVDVSMLDVSDNAGNSRDVSRSPTSSTPATLSQKGSIPSGLRGLFEMKIVTSNTEVIPHGYSALEENRDYPSMLSRLPRKSGGKSIHRRRRVNRFPDATNSPASSDDELSQAPEPVNKKLPRPADESEESDIPNLHHDIESESESEIYSGINRLYPRSGKRSRHAIAAKSQTRSGPLIRPGEGIVLDWNDNAYDSLFGADPKDRDSLRGAPTWTNVDRVPDPELVSRRQLRQTRKKRGVTLDECLDEFGKEEILSENDAWYCPRCKEHRRASKKFELWKAPDVLVVHFKRFSANRGFRDKLDLFVDFPVEGLDLTRRVAAPEEGRSLVYDLFGVDNHYGGLGGGHYTAYVKSFLTNEWNEYNDSHVSKPIDPQRAVTSAAYLLFYRRRSDQPLGGKILQAIAESSVRVGSDSDSQFESRAESPTGEGRRLDGSSRIGSSSALAGVGAAHHAGVGGLRAVTRVRSVADNDDDEVQAQFSHSLSSVEQSLEHVGGMEVTEDGIFGVGNPLNFPSQNWSFSRVSDLPGPSQITAAPPGSYYDGEEDLFDDDASNKAVGGGDQSDSDLRLAALTDSPGDTGAPFPSTSFEDPPIEDIPPPLEVDDDSELPVVELRVNEEDRIIPD